MQSLLAVNFGEIFGNLYEAMGFVQGTDWKNYVMLLISFILMYLAIVKKFELRYNGNKQRKRVEGYDVR